MNDTKQSNQTEAGNDTLTTLLNLAGPSAEIESDVEQRVYANVRREWSRSKLRSQPLRWALPFALAASVLIVFGLKGSDVVPQARSVGSVMVAAAQPGAEALTVGDSVYAGDVLDTSKGHGMSLALQGDISLRMDSATLLKVDSANEFTLMAGRIYIDTGDRIYADRHVTVHTASGSATDVGTQFSVLFDNADMSVAVREGRVDLKEGGQTHTAKQGDKVTVRPGRIARFEIVPVVGESWDWAVALAPMFDIEGQSLLDFLKWVSRETGMGLRIQSDEVRMETMQSRLHGSVDGMTPIDALDAVLATTHFKYSIDGNTITIKK